MINIENIINNIEKNKIINDKLKYEIINKFSKLSKKFRKSIKPKLKKYYIHKYFDKNIIEIMGGIENMNKIPILEWEDKFLGGTDYIDRIEPENLKHKVMIGIDRYERPFICFRIKTYSKYYEEIFNVDTLFQRYTGEKNTWTNGTCGSIKINPESGYFYSRGVFRNEYVKQNIKNLLENKGFILKTPLLYSDNNIKKINVELN